MALKTFASKQHSLPLRQGPRELNKLLPSLLRADVPKSAAAAEVVGQSSPTCEAKLFLGALGALRKSVTPTTKSVTHGRTLTAGDNTLSSLSVALPILWRDAVGRGTLNPIVTNEQCY